MTSAEKVQTLHISGEARNLFAKANETYADVQQHQTAASQHNRKALESGRETGAYLVKAREAVWKCDGCKWNEALMKKSLFHGGKSNAYNFIRIAENWNGALLEERKRNPNLSLDAALEFLRNLGGKKKKQQDDKALVLAKFVKRFERMVRNWPSRPLRRLAHDQTFFDAIEQTARKRNAAIKQARSDKVIHKTPFVRQTEPQQPRKKGGQLVTREQLVKDLEMVSPGLSGKEFIDQSHCFIFKEGCVMTFNDEIACKKPTVLSLTGAVSQTLLKVVTQLDEEELEIVESKNSIEVYGSKSSFTVWKDPEIFLQIEKVEVPEPKQWRSLANGFSEAILQVLPCVTKDDSKFILTCVHIHPRHIETTDNFQAMRCNVETGVSNSISVRASAVASIVELYMTEIAVTKNWLHFRNKAGLVYSVRHYAESYPDLNHLFNNTGEMLQVPRQLAASLKRARLFTKDDTLVRVRVEPGWLYLQADGNEGYGQNKKPTSYEERYEVKYNGPRVDFLMDIEILQRIAENYEQWDLDLEKKRLAVSGDNWEYVAVLSAPRNEAKMKPRISANNGKYRQRIGCAGRARSKDTLHLARYGIKTAGRA